MIKIIVEQCLEPEPARRPPSALHVAAALSRAVRLEEPQALEHLIPSASPEYEDVPSTGRVWRLLGTTLAGTALLLLLAPWSSGVGLSFKNHGPEGSLVQAFTWLWCLGLQIFLVLVVIAFVLKARTRPDLRARRAPETVYSTVLQ